VTYASIVHACLKTTVAGGVTLVCLAATLAPLASAGKPSLAEACFNAIDRQQRRHPRELKTAPPAALTSILGVLRRPATPADRIPATALRATNPSDYRAIWPRATRLLGVGPHRTHYYLVVGDLSPQALPIPCFKLQPHHSGRPPKPSVPFGDVATVVQYSSTPTGEDTGDFPYASSWISAGRATLFEPAEPETALVPYFALVPDGVASVAVTVGSNPTTRIPVTENFALAQIPNPREGDTIVQQWYGADGTLIKTVTEKLGVIISTG